MWQVDKAKGFPVFREAFFSATIVTYTCLRIIKNCLYK